jgi:hypothetical protein
VLVPAYAVVCPDKITIAEIVQERNEEVRRTLIDQFGWEKYLHASRARMIDSRNNDRDNQVERLFDVKDGPRRFICVDPSTGRRYALGVPREIATCEAAQHWLSSGLDRFAIHRS